MSSRRIQHTFDSRVLGSTKTAISDRLALGLLIKLVLGGVMQCPVCEAEHTSRPRECLQHAILDHVGSCGIGTDHRFECLLKLLNDYVDSNPLWNKGGKK